MPKLPLSLSHPALCQEWHRARNGTLTPADLSAGSHRTVWWRCPKGHAYAAQVFSRTAGTGCPYCAGKQPIPGETDLATSHPELSAEWDSENNAPLTPAQVTAGSHRRVWWRCALGHAWQAAPFSRAAGSGCPYCANRRVLPGFNDLTTTHPKLCREWDETLNAPLTPETLTFGSNRKVWWRCDDGHVWQAAVFSRTRARPSGCPVCAGTVKPRTRPANPDARRPAREQPQGGQAPGAYP